MAFAYGSHLFDRAGYAVRKRYKSARVYPCKRARTFAHGVPDFSPSLLRFRHASILF